MNINFDTVPTTRYQGSKRKLLPWLYKYFCKLSFNKALDIFGGTGVVSYMLKKMGKSVTYNDYLRSNYLIGLALIENDKVRLTDEDVDYLITKHKTIKYGKVVQEIFNDIYYLHKENIWIDKFLANWNNLADLYSPQITKYKKALAFYAFAQSAIKKRPFNLFHRSNLYLRTNDVKRKFGNKTSWDGSFNDYFKFFANEANKSVFSNGHKNKSLNCEVHEFSEKEDFDFLYIDPPYIRKEAYGSDVDYFKFYHFLEGSTDYKDWKLRIRHDTKNNLLINSIENDWISPHKNRNALEEFLLAYPTATVVISYKEPGIPSKRQIVNSLKKSKKYVFVAPAIKYAYALNKNNGFHQEYLVIGSNRSITI